MSPYFKLNHIFLFWNDGNLGSISSGNIWKTYLSFVKTKHRVHQKAFGVGYIEIICVFE